jgi:hypothetical protein
MMLGAIVALAFRAKREYVPEDDPEDAKPVRARPLRAR